MTDPGGSEQPPEEPSRFDPVAILHTLDRHGVDYIVIGGVAANLHGSNQPTRDIDLAYDVTGANKERLAAALIELGAVRQTDPEGAAVPAPDQFVYRVEHFSTSIGDVDAFQYARHIGGYRDLLERAVTYDVEGAAIPVADIDDIILSKAGSGREKDPAHIRALERLKAELAAQRIEELTSPQPHQASSGAPSSRDEEPSPPRVSRDLGVEDDGFGL